MSSEDESLVDYFVVATKRLDGSPAELAFAYPPHDSDPEETEFCENICMFMVPHGYASSWDGRSLPPPPAHNLFTLTDAHGDHLYGASLSFFESPASTTAPRLVKSIGVLTRRPFYTAMLRYLEQLLLLGIQQEQRARASSSTGPSEGGGGCNVERALCNLFHEVPVPHRGLAVQMQIAELEITLERPPFTDFPFEMDAELMLYAFMTIDPKVLLQLYHHVLLEHCVLVVGNDSVLVTAVVETLKSLLFPMTWLHVVVPSVPDSLDLSTLLEAPVPFLAGAHSAQLCHVTVPSNIVRYDISEGRLIAPSANNNNNGQDNGDSGVLPPLPDASARLLQKLASIRLADLHLQKKDLHQKLWDRRIQLQKACMAPLAASASAAAGITPRNVFLVRQSLVHKKMMKLYLELVAALVQDFAPCVSHQTRQLELDKFVERKPAAARAFFQAFAQTAHFQSFVAQHHDYASGQLALDDAMKFHFVHRTLLHADKARANGSGSSSGSGSGPSSQTDLVAAHLAAQTKTFVAHTPQLELLEPQDQPSESSSSSLATARGVDLVLFPSIRVDEFGTPREVAFPTLPHDAVHASLGTLLAPSSVGSRRVSKDGADWMQALLRSVPLLPAAAKQRGVDLLTASSSYSSSSGSSSSSSSNNEKSFVSLYGAPTARPGATPSLPAPFKRSRTIDRLKSAAPFYRTMTQRALESSLRSVAAVAAPAPPPTRAETVVRSIWLITTAACSCRAEIVALTQQLAAVLQLTADKTSSAAIDAYCALIAALSQCGHPSEAKAVFEECLSGSALVSLAPIAALPHFWRAFSVLLRGYVRNGLVQRAFDLLVQVELDEEQLLDPSSVGGALPFAAQVLGADQEVLVERLFATFTCGNLGMCLAPRAGSATMGCELIAFQDKPEATDGSAGADSDIGADAGRTTETTEVERMSALRPHDVVETINGELVLHHAFADVITALKQASRPMTLTFLRGLDRLDAAHGGSGGSAFGDADGLRRSSSSASAVSLASISAVVDGKNAASSSSSSSTKGTPRRDLCDRFGLLPRRGIRVTALADCPACGARLSLTDVQRGWSGDSSDYTTRCPRAGCAQRFVPRLCVMLGVMTVLYRPTRRAAASATTPELMMQDAKVEQLEYLSMPVLRKELMNLAQKVPLTLLSMTDLREMNPRLYWNIVVKLLSLAVPLDFLELPDMTHPKQQQTRSKKGSTAATMSTAVSAREAAADAEELKALKELVLKRATRLRGEHQKMEDTVSCVLKELEQQLKQEQSAAKKAAAATGSDKKPAPTSSNGSGGSRRWSLLGGYGKTPVVTPLVVARSISGSGSGNANDRDGDADDDADERGSGDERETDVEDMRSSRTLSVTDSIGSELDSQQQQHLGGDRITPRKSKRPSSRYLPSLSSAPFRRSSRTMPAMR